MKDRGIGYNPGLYKVFSRDVSSQVDLKMAVQEPLKLDRIYHSLSASQKKTCGISEKLEGSGGESKTDTLSYKRQKKEFHPDLSIKLLKKRSSWI